MVPFICYTNIMKTLFERTKELIEILSQQQQTVTCAESCTGGRIAAALTAVPGASAVLHGTVVTYANTIKHRWLGVKESTLETYGAVSRECVDEMLSGVLEMADADCAIAVSGIAGPAGGTPDKPVGTVYIGIRTPKTSTVYHNVFKGDRESIQDQSVVFAIEKLLHMLKK